MKIKINEYRDKGFIRYKYEVSYKNCRFGGNAKDIFKLIKKIKSTLKLYAQRGLFNEG